MIYDKIKMRHVSITVILCSNFILLKCVNVIFQVPVYGSFRNAFQNIRSVLVEKIDVSHGLIDLLLQHGVLLDSHVSDIQVRTTPTVTAH